MTRTRYTTPHCRRGAGVMLVEAAVCVVIVAVMLVAALQTVGAAARARRVQVSQCQGPALARQLLAEIRQCRYEEPPAVVSGAGGATGMTVVAAPLGPDPGEVDGKSRLMFDDVDDYDGLDDDPPRARDGTNLKGAGDWQRKVSVVYVQPDAPDVVVADDRGVKRITVTVTGPGGAVATLVALRSKFDGYEQLPRARTTYVTAVNVVLRLGEDGTRIHSGASLANQVEVPP